MDRATLWVGNLPYPASEDNVCSLFRDYGVVRAVRIPKDRETDSSRGYCFVEMDAEGAAKAKDALDYSEFMGRRIRVNDSSVHDGRARRGDKAE